MSDLLLSLTRYFKTKYDIIDNNMCRFHYKATVAILIGFSILVTAKQYFGDPIDCVVPKDSIDLKMLDTYCWIHKTFSVEKAFKGELGSEVAYPGMAAHKKGDKLVYHSYYQWVCFVLFLQAVAFYIPRFLWKMAEGSRIEHLSGELKNPVLEDSKRTSHIKLLVEYMKANATHHTTYFYPLVAVEILYLVNIVAQMYLMDIFLGGEFSKYGWKVLMFTEWSWEARYDPMIKVFPRMAKCTFRMYGSSGGIQTLDAACVLPINIINEKIYVILWFWFVALTAITSVWMVYRAATILLSSLRVTLLQRKAPTIRGEVVEAVVVHSDAADWFMMYQISKNVDPLHFECFFIQYAKSLKLPELHKLLDEESELCG